MTQPETFFSVDVETSGPVPGFHDLLRIGACLVERPEIGFMQGVRPFHGHADPESLAVNGMTMEGQYLAGLPLEKVVSAFDAWVRDNVPDGGKAVFVALNAPFDWGFVLRAFHDVVLPNPFHFVPIDVKALYMGATGCTWDETRSSRMHVALSPTQHPDHADPLVDARYQAELFRLVRAIPGRFPEARA